MRPYSLSFASASASSSVSNMITGATGPKISSRHAACSVVTSARTVGPVEQASCLPPTTTRAPASTERRTMPSTRASCCSLTIGPRSTSSRYGSPRRSRSAFSASRSMYASATLRWTMWRPVAKQTWPWNWNEAKAPAEAAASRSASSRTTNALLPPSSSDDALEQLAGERADPPAGLRRAGEEDPGQVRVGHDGLAGLGVAEDDVEQAVGQPGLAEHRLEHRAAADRRLRVGLEDRRRCRRRAPARRRASRARSGSSTGVITPMTPTGTRRSIERRPGTTLGTSWPYGWNGIVAAALSSPTAKFCSWCIFAVDRAGLALGPAAELRAVRLVDLGGAPEDRGRSA